MKNYSPILTIYLASILSINLNAQNPITGRIFDHNGVPLIGANILEKGVLSNYTISENDGNFSISVSDSSRLIVSYVGYQDQEVILDGSQPLAIKMEEGLALSTIVVTALGISQEQKSLGYSVQELGADNLSFTRESNLISSLAGKIAGVQVTTASGASIGGSANIRIRGSNGLTGGSPLFVIDGTPVSNRNFSASIIGTDYGNLAQDINPDDIEKISVLKGPSATALYGNRAANGVVMITTKKGQVGQGIGVTVNSSISSQRVYLLPEYQNVYAGGYDGHLQEYVDPVDGQTYPVLEYYADESWGPKMDGSLYRPWWSWYPGENYGEQIPLSARPDNIKDFFDRGLTLSNNVAISNRTEQGSFRLSFTNIKQNGVMPNSSLDRNNLSLSTSKNLTAKLQVEANLNLVSIDGTGRPEFGYSLNNPVLSFNQWFQRQLDLDDLRDYKNSDGSFSSWNIRSPANLRPLYWDSPYFSLYENYSTDGRDRYFGNVTLRYQISSALKIEGSFRRDQYTQRIEKRVASGGLEEAFYSEFVADAAEDNYDFLIDYNRRFKEFSINAYFGSALRNNVYHSNYAGTAGGLSATNLFNLSASVDRPSLNSYISNKKVQSIYGAINVGYKGLFYLGGTLRNDWSSALPERQNSYLYPSISGSLIFSEFIKIPFISFGKLRLSYAQVGSDIDPYQTLPGFVSSNSYGSLPAFVLPGTLVNENLRPALSSSIEFGLEVSMMKNRFGIDLTYYKENNKDQILRLQVPGSSGYYNAIVNAGNIEDQGIEISLRTTPVKRWLIWDLTLNLAKNTSKVLELAEGLNNRQLEEFGWGGFSINAPVGGKWGMMRGTAFSRINGKPIIDEEGNYEILRDQDLGTFLPDFTGGVLNQFRFFGFEINAFIDFQVGGQFHSITKMFNAYSGLSRETAGINDRGVEVRAPIDEGGGIRVDGVLSDGSSHTVYVSPENHYKGLFALNERWIYDATYFKLREISLGYHLPKKWIKALPITSGILSLTGHNFWIIYSKVKGIDPSEISPGSNPYVSHESGILPGVQSFGINLKLTF